MKYLYRCVAARHGWYDAEMDVGHSYINGVEYISYQVVKETEKGFWITRHSGWPASWVKKINHTECRFVLKGNGKRFANETKEDAYYNLTRRAYSRKYILEQQIKENEQLISYIEARENKEKASK